MLTSKSALGLDPRSSRLTDGNVNTFGCTCPIFNSNAVLDISEGARSIPDNSHFHPGFQNFGSVPGATVTVPPWTLTDSESGEGDQDEDQAQENEIEDGVGNGDGDDEENEVVDEEEDEVENEDEVQGIIEDEDEGADVSGFNETDEFGEIAVQDTHMAEFEEALIDHWGGQTEQQVIEGKQNL